MPSVEKYLEHPRIECEGMNVIADIEITIDRFLALEKMIISDKLPPSYVMKVMSDIPGFKRWFDAREHIRKTWGNDHLDQRANDSDRLLADPA